MNKTYKNKLNILILSSRPSHWSADLGYDLAKIILDKGHHVDYVTTYSSNNQEKWEYSIYDKMIDINPMGNPRSLSKKILSFFNNPIEYINRAIKKILKKSYYIISSSNEETPTIPIELLLKKIPSSEYDAIITQFWHKDITSLTLKALYDRFNCPIIILATDMIPVTGGCANMYECTNYQNECRKCPCQILPQSINPHENFLKKKEIYRSIKCFICGNTWMLNVYRKTNLFSEDQLIKKVNAINQNNFRYLDKIEARDKLNLPVDKYIFFCGAANLNEKRKGFHIIVQTLNRFIREHPDANILLVLVGKKIDNINKFLSVPVKEMGFVGIKDLSLLYSAADAYLSPTIMDAGPSMVCQSILCGCPVVAFKVGVAMDLIRKGINGYLADYNDVDDYYTGIKLLYEQKFSDENRKSCSNSIKEVSSYENSLKLIENIVKNTNK